MASVENLTVAEAAARSKRHPVTIRKALEAESLHGHQRVPRGRWMIREDCLQAWVECRPCPHRSNVLRFPKAV